MNFLNIFKKNPFAGFSSDLEPKVYNEGDSVSENFCIVKKISNMTVPAVYTYYIGRKNCLSPCFRCYEEDLALLTEQECLILEEQEKIRQDLHYKLIDAEKKHRDKRLKELSQKIWNAEGLSFEEKRVLEMEYNEYQNLKRGF